MKKVILFFLSICFFLNSQAQVSKTISVTTAGTLTTLLTLNEKTTITNLIVTGNIDARDFKCMRDELTVLTVLDMNAVTIMAYTGSDGTFINETTMYPENEIPQFSFYYSNPTKAPLKSITLPNSLTSIGGNAFTKSFNLTVFITQLNNLNYSVLDGVLFNKIQTTLIQYPVGKKGAYIIPKTVKSIGSGAFSESQYLSNITIGSEVETIGSYAFFNCNELEYLTFNSVATTIGTSAFCNCGKLSGILSIPNSVTSIGNTAFYKCSGLSGINIGSGIDTIGTSVFSDCSGLTGNLNIPNSVTIISDYAFQNCTGLTNLTIGSGITSIGNYAFNNCIGLTGNLAIPNSVKKIGGEAFISCNHLTGLSIGSGVNTIGEGAFFNCVGLKGNLTIPDSVTSIGNGAFSCCSGITTLTIGSGVTSIGETAFSSCTGLTGNLVFPDSVDSIKNNAFFYCTGLTSLSFGSGIRSIGSMAFDSCDNLRIINCLNSIPPSVGSYAFDGLSLVTDVYVPTNEAVTAYKADKYWFRSFPGNIIKTNTFSGISGLANSRVKVYNNLSEIIIEGIQKDERMSIYTVNGRLLNTFKSQGVRITIPVQSHAIYFIRTESKSYKVIL